MKKPSPLPDSGELATAAPPLQTTAPNPPLTAGHGPGSGARRLRRAALRRALPPARSPRRGRRPRPHTRRRRIRRRTLRGQRHLRGAHSAPPHSLSCRVTGGHSSLLIFPLIDTTRAEGLAPGAADGRGSPSRRPLLRPAPMVRVEVPLLASRVAMLIVFRGPITLVGGYPRGRRIG